MNDPRQPKLHFRCNGSRDSLIAFPVITNLLPDNWLELNRNVIFCLYTHNFSYLFLSELCIIYYRINWEKKVFLYDIYFSLKLLFVSLVESIYSKLRRLIKKLSSSLQIRK